MNLAREHEIKKVVELRDIEKLSWIEIANKLNFSERTAQRRYSNHLLQQEVSSNGYYVPEYDTFDYSRFTPIERIGDCVISCDWHIPLHDKSMVNKLIKKAHDENISNLIIAGDFLNMDSFSHYRPHQPEADFGIEREEATQTMKTLLKTFDEIDLIWGNHEHRISKFVNFKHSFEVLMRWVFSGLTSKEHDKLRISDLDHMIYKTDNKVFRVCHPGHFSKIPLTIPRQLALKYACSIITAHSHHCAIGVAQDGKNLILEGGGLFDKHKTQYVQRTTTHHEWVQGFTIFKDNIPTLYSPVLGNI